jgi:hypothetical protein
MKRYVAWAALLALVVSCPFMMAGREAGQYYDEFVRNDAEGDTAGADTIRYFAQAGSLTTIADSAISLRGMDFFELHNLSAVLETVRIYHKGGRTQARTDSAYTTIVLRENPDSVYVPPWKNPDGMRVIGLQFLTDPESVLVKFGR